MKGLFLSFLTIFAYFNVAIASDFSDLMAGSKQTVSKAEEFITQGQAKGYAELFFKEAILNTIESRESVARLVGDESNLKEISLGAGELLALGLLGKLANNKISTLAPGWQQWFAERKKFEDEMIAYERSARAEKNEFMGTLEYACAGLNQRLIEDLDQNEPKALRSIRLRLARTAVLIAFPAAMLAVSADTAHLVFHSPEERQNLKNKLRNEIASMRNELSQ